MKRVGLITLMLLGLSAFAQKSNVESAAIYLRNGELEDAKKAIDQAVVHEETKGDPKAWFYYVAILDTIYRNPAYSGLAEADLVDKFYNGCKKCIETDVKGRYKYYCKEQALLNSAFMCWNKGIAAYENKDFNKAVAYYQMVLDIIPMDVNGDLKKNNLSEKNIYLYMAYAALQGNDKPRAKSCLKKLIDLNYDDPRVFMQMASLHMEDGDTAQALQVVETGRTRLPGDKDLINQELNIYLNMGKQDILLEKLNAAVESNPEDANLIYVRGNVYDNAANEIIRRAKHSRDTSSTLSKKALTEKDPKKKATFSAASANYQKKYTELMNQSKEYSTKAEVDYKKAVELNPDLIDAYFNLGALTNNKTTDVVEKINSLPVNISQAEYDKRYNPLKKQKDEILNVALGYFNQALAIAEAKSEDTPEKKKEKYNYMRDILYSIQQVYANLDNEKMAIETKKKRELYD